MRVFLSVIYWNHSKFLWNSDNLPIRIPWYGLCFSLGILFASMLGIYLALSSYVEEDRRRFSKNQLREALENFALYSLLFIIPGSRIAYILFYGGDFYFKHPQEILKVWNGGLASHGGMVGLILWAIIFSWRYRKKIPILTFLFLCDLCASVFGCAAFMIRIGNFMNQEIIGKPTNLPWGIIFSSPTQGSLGLSVHPVQLYEGIGYLLLSIILFFLSYKRYLRLGSGWATSWGLIGISLIRFFAEFFKSHQGKVIGPDSLLTMGQILSLPLFIFGVSLGVACFIKNKKSTSSTSSIK
ncbi:prolipoprotein diacylglyceryl transferase [Chlamydia crocodili]|uniref:Phosphatidylglycerol--prolipoprotein diacylglyceryl transferase n=1 Tax=Chlamydia crocodili TaxID=2766982 RepID=A0ABX8CDB9_9CHLA|nr:prolipoprotein diacylglyceryl transferase [Chlamydia crocodili]QVE49013.1 prolipoprotein diacylglyceryl transferase [Chlamydia crocodili]